MGLMDSFKARKALMEHRKGNVAAARPVYEELYAKGYLDATYMVSWSYILLREGGEENYKKVKEILAKAQKDPRLNEQNRHDLPWPTTSWATMKRASSCWNACIKRAPQAIPMARWVIC